MPKKISWSIVTLACAAFMMFMALKPVAPGHAQDQSIWPSVLENFMHVLAFGALTLCLYFTFKVFNVRLVLTSRVFMVALLYGILIEVLQAFTPDRDPSFLDVCLDACGSLLMIVLINGWEEWKIAQGSRLEAGGEGEDHSGPEAQDL